jgi:beta-lactamase regulating signal transducer with metallopeptidase domain
MIEVSSLLREDVQVAFLNLSQGAAAALLTAVWQGALVAGTLTVCLRFVPRTTASLRFALWAAGFVLVAVLPFLPALVTGRASHAVVGGASAGHVWLQLDVRWSVAITAIWALASLYRAGDLAVHCLRLRRLWSTAVPVADATMQVANGRRVELCMTDEVDRPSVIGFFRPRILIPSWLLEQLSDDELKQIVLHEMEHLRRRDDWTNLLQKLSLVLFPINPVLLWMERRLCREREMACDDGVVRVTQAPKSYAACLASLAERGMAHRSSLAALALGAWQRRPELVERVHSLLRRGRVLGPVGSRALAGTVGCTLVAGAFGLSRCPQLVGFRSSQPQTVARMEASAKKAISASSGRTGDAYFGSPAAAIQRVSLPSKAHFSAVPLKATLTTPPAAMLVSSFAEPSLPMAHPATKRNQEVLTAQKDSASLTNSVVNALNTPYSNERIRGEQARAEMVRWSENMADISGDQGQGESYLVLTTWEEDVRPAANTVQSDMAQQNDDARQPSDHISKPAIYRRTVTRMIFRVVPASFDSTLYAGSPASNERGGWLIFQL